jgi:hypothetical protein
MLDDAHKLSLIHALWHRKTGYFDEDGHPKTIAKSGPAPSYEALCAECGVLEKQESLLDLALVLEMCAQVGRHRVGYLSDIALFTGIPSLMLARTTVNVERFLKTCEFNATPGRKVGQSLADRTAVVDLSKKEFLEFANAMRGNVHNFLESTDRRALACVARSARRLRVSRDRRPSGVTAFVFRD